MDRKRGNFFTVFQPFLSLSFSRFVAAGINGLFWFYLASIITKSDYGELGFLISIGTVGHSIALLGIPTLIVVYGAKKENVLPAGYTLGLISASLVALVAYILIQNVSVSIFILGMMIFSLKISELNMKKRYSSYSLYIILQRILTIIFAIILYQFFGIDGIVLGFSLMAILGLEGLYNYFKNKKFSFSLLKPKIGFMKNVWLSNLSTILFWWGDKLIIGTLFGFTILGSYLLAAQFLLLLNSVPGALSVYLLPQESEGRQNKKLKMYAVVFGILIVVASIIGIPYAIEILLPDYTESIFAIQIMSIGIIPLVIAAIKSSELLGRERSKVILIGSSLNVILYFTLLVFLGSQFGLVGIATAFLASTIFIAVFYFFAKIK